MKAKIVDIRDAGTLRSERVVLKVVTRTDIGGYLLCDTTYTSDGIVSNQIRHPFWFPDKVVDAGDFVVLYTKSGTDSAFKNKSGTQTHRFYWGLERTIWNEAGDGVVLFEVAEWRAKRLAPREDPQ